MDLYACTRRDDCGEQHSECDHYLPHERMDTCDNDTCPAVEGHVECIKVEIKKTPNKRQ